jgi:ribonuclease HII
MVIVGIDEAGIGCIAGPMVIAAAAFKEGTEFPRFIRDSKTMTSDHRENVVDVIYGMSEYVLIATVQASYINRHKGVWEVWDKTMAAVLKLIQANKDIGKIIVDGTRLVEGFRGITYEAKADKNHKQVSAASIVAKYVQTSAMEDLHDRQPKYGFNKHHGYGTAEHMRALKEFGPIPDHRAHYKPVEEAIKALPAERRQELESCRYPPAPVDFTVVEGGFRDDQM